MDNDYGMVLWALMIWIIVPALILVMGAYFGVDYDTASTAPETWDDAVNLVYQNIEMSIGSIPIVGGALEFLIDSVIWLCDSLFGTIIGLIYPVIGISVGVNNTLVESFGVPAWVGTLLVSIWVLIPVMWLVKEVVVPIVS